MKKILLSVGLLTAILNSNAMQLTNGFGPLKDGNISQPRAIGNVVEYVEQPVGGQITTLFILHPKNTRDGNYLDASVSRERFNGATSRAKFQTLANEPLQPITPFVSAQGQALDITFFKNSQGEIPAGAVRIPLTSMITLLGRQRQSITVGGDFFTMRDGLVRSASTAGTADYLMRIFGPRPIIEEPIEDRVILLNDTEAEMAIGQVGYLRRHGRMEEAEVALQEIIAIAGAASTSGSSSAASSSAGPSASGSQDLDPRFEELMRQYIALQERLGEVEEHEDTVELRTIREETKGLRYAVDALNQELEESEKEGLKWVDFVTKAFKTGK